MSCQACRLAQCIARGKRQHVRREGHAAARGVMACRGSGGVGSRVASLRSACRRRTADTTPATSPKGDPNPYVSAEGHTIVDVRFCAFPPNAPCLSR